MGLSTRFLFCCIAGCVMHVSSAAQTTYLSQDFSGSSTVSDYVSSTPNSGQFNSISISNGTVSINAGELEYQRTGSGSGILSRTTDFSPTPSILIVEFDLTVPSSDAAQTTAAILYVGQNFATGTAVPSTTDVHSRIGVNFIGNSGGFSLRRINTPASSSGTFTGQQHVTWVINNSGASYSYTGPDGNNQTLANDAADVFVGTTQVFDEIPATSADAALTDFKFIFNGGSGSTNGTIRIDNISITSPADAPLPVELTDFRLSVFKNNAVQVSWTTASEINNAGFEIYRSEGNSQSFKKIASYITNAELTGLGTSPYGKNYSYTDGPGVLKNGRTYFYKIVDVDFDGTRTEHDAKSILFLASSENTLKDQVILSPNPVRDVATITVSLNEEDDVTIFITDILGKKVLEIYDQHRFTAGKFPVTIPVNTLPFGVYNLVMKTSNDMSVLPLNVIR